MKLWKTAKRELKRHLTVMFIPHNTIRPLRITFTFSFLLFLIGLWSGLTIWAGYLSSRHIDYWIVKTDNELLKLKVTFFAKQVEKSRDLLEQVRENDEQLRALLEMKSKKEILENDGKGGPTPLEVVDLNRALSGKIHEMDHRDIYRHTAALREVGKRQLDSYREIFSYIENQRALHRAVPTIRPCSGFVTSPFGMRFHPIYQSNEFHSGLDIANAKNTPIYATAYGVVRLCDWQPGYGRLIVVNHGYGYTTYYGHLQKILVKKGDYVKRGQLIGLMGDTGTSTGYHCHYEVQFNGRPTNPVRFVRKDALEFTKK